RRSAFLCVMWSRLVPAAFAVRTVARMERERNAGRPCNLAGPIPDYATARRRRAQGSIRATASSTCEPCFKLRVKVIVAREDVAEVGDRNRFGAMLAQEGRQRMHLGGRAMQRHHSGRGRLAERQYDPEATSSGEA